MDTNSIIAIIVGVIAAYLFIRLVLNPAIKAALGIIVFIIIIYLLRRFFNFNLLGPYSAYLDKLNPLFNLVSGPINNSLGQLKNIFNHAFSNLPKTSTK